MRIGSTRGPKLKNDGTRSARAEPREEGTGRTDGRKQEVRPWPFPERRFRVDLREAAEMEASRSAAGEAEPRREGDDARHTAAQSLRL